jgi:hypothetical protein
MSLLSFQLAVDASLVTLSWLVQLVVYPAFAAVAPAHFGAWHAGYTRRISWLVVPLMLGQLALHGAALVRTPAATSVTAAVLVAIAWLATFFAAVPCHRRFQTAGFDPAVHQRLLRANLLRTVAWTSVVIVDLVAGGTTG